MSFHFIQLKFSLQIAGLNLTFIHIPGETPDQMGVWLADQRVLLPADDIYKTFPNLYAIRGTAPRDSLVWVESLRLMRDLDAEYLVPSHMRPIAGRRTIYETLTVYVSAIQFVHDQTVRRFNQLHHPDEIAQMVKLPKSLAGHPYLQEFYGTVAWSAKGVFERYLGWFSGDAVDLKPFTPAERSRRMLRLVGGARRLLDEAELASKAGDFQWALELSSHVFRLDPDDHRAKEIRLSALRSLAGVETNPLARNFYMTAALDDHGLVDWSMDVDNVIDKSEMLPLLKLMKIRLVAELADGINMTVCLKFDDSQEEFRLQILYSVLTVERSAVGCDLADSSHVLLTTTTGVWRELLKRKRSSAMAYASGELSVKGSLLNLRKFFSLFRESS